MSGDFLKVESTNNRQMRLSVIRSKNVDTNEFGIPSVSLMENLEKSQRLSRMFQLQALEKRVSMMRPKMPDASSKPVNTETAENISNEMEKEKDRRGDSSPLSPSNPMKGKHPRTSQVQSLFKRNKEKKGVQQQAEPKEQKVVELREEKSIKIDAQSLKKHSSAFENQRKSTISYKRESTFNAIPLNMMTRKSSMFRKEDDLKNMTQKDLMRNLDLDLFSSEQLIEMAIVILNKPSTLRTAMDIKIAKKCTNNVKFFQDIIKENGEEIHEQCCKYMTHKMLRANEVLFYEGNIGTSFYIILKGSVGINKFDKRIQESIQTNFKKMKKAVKTKAVEPQTPKATPKTSIFEVVNTLRTKIDENTPQMADIQECLDRMVPEDLDQRGALVEVKQLGSGSAFGELALMDNKPRAATIICKEDSQFAVLDKFFFNQILREAEQKKLDAQLQFFASMKIFDGMSYNAVKNLYYFSTQIEYIRNQFVYKQNDLSEEIYLIKSGEFKIIKGLTNSDSPSRQRNDTVEEDIPKLLLKRNKFSTPKTYEIAILGEGETFGEEEVVLNIRRKFSVICNSQKGVLFIVNKKEFFKRVFSEDKVNEILKKQINTKTEWRGKRVETFIMNSQILSPDPPKTPFPELKSSVNINEFMKDEQQVLSEGEQDMNYVSSGKKATLLESIFEKKGGKSNLGTEKSQKEVMKKLMIHFNKNRVKTQTDNIRSHMKRNTKKHKTISPKGSRGGAPDTNNLILASIIPLEEPRLHSISVNSELKKIEHKNHEHEEKANDENKNELGAISLGDYFKNQKQYRSIYLPLKPNSENIKFSESLGTLPTFKSATSHGNKKLKKERPYFMSGAKTDRHNSTLENLEKSSEVHEAAFGRALNSGIRTASELSLRKSRADLFVNCERIKIGDLCLDSAKSFTPKKNGYFDLKSTKSKLVILSTSPKPFDSSLEQRPQDQMAGQLDELKRIDGLENQKCSIELPHQPSVEKNNGFASVKASALKMKSELLPLKYLAEVISENSITKASQIKRVIKKYSNNNSTKNKKNEPPLTDFYICVEK